MYDHVGLKVKDIAASVRFYEAALKPLGFVKASGDEISAGFGPKDAPALWLNQGAGGGPAHLAFSAKDRAAVDKFHAAGMAAGAKDNGKPGPRDYGPNYYAAFLVDPDGNNLEAVCLK
jgi:catechol 2,3-dioxygenase-like lactoylglutathione lyase family enzyme